jgi:putative transcriptional regulator
MTKNNTPASFVKDARASLSMTQRVFAKFLGVSVVTVNRWEKGYHEPSKLAMDKLDSILEAVKQEVSEKEN